MKMFSSENKSAPSSVFPGSKVVIMFCKKKKAKKQEKEMEW